MAEVAAPLRSQSLPGLLPGFEHINRYFDPIIGMPAAKLLPGEYFVSPHAEVLVTVLGSCVAACIRDPVAKIGGMNHFMLPTHGKFSPELADASANRYGNYAMESLITTLLSNGAQRDRLEVKLFGGGRVLGVDSDVGARNIDFARRYLAEQGLEIRANDLGGRTPRKVHYYAGTGRVHVRKLLVLKNDTIQKREGHYRAELAHRMEIMSTSYERNG